jgi:heme oxygenase (biliverdin-IX-beta and delta-forming)
LEAALVDAGVSQIFPDWKERARSGAVLTDLGRVGGARPIGSPAPERFGVEEMFGTLYVLEGSRLGARVLLRIVEKSPHPRVADTTNYLRHGVGAPLWQSFLLNLERCAGLSEFDAVIAGACRAFELFEKSFSSSDR